MANASDIDAVRRNTGELTSTDYDDEAIDVLVDSLGIAGASAAIWREKGAKFAGLVDVSESGASHKYSDLHKNALAMAKTWDDREVTAGELLAGRVHIGKIVRS